MTSIKEIHAKLLGKSLKDFQHDGVIDEFIIHDIKNSKLFAISIIKKYGFIVHFKYWFMHQYSSIQ